MGATCTAGPAAVPRPHANWQSPALPKRATAFALRVAVLRCLCRQLPARPSLARSGLALNARRRFELLGKHPALQDKPGAAALAPSNHSVDFHDVCFQASGGAWEELAAAAQAADAGALHRAAAAQHVRYVTCTLCTKVVVQCGQKLVV